MHALTQLDKKQHGTLEFPVEYYYVDCKHPRYQMPFHWHNEWELLRVLDGTFQICVDDDKYSLHAGDILLMHGGMLHGGQPNDGVYECLVFDLHGLFRTVDMVKPYLRSFYRQNFIPQCWFPAGQDDSLHTIVAELMEAITTEYKELDTLVGIGRLFVWILKNKRYRIAQEPSYSGIQRIQMLKSVLEYIETHYETNISLEDLAQIAGMNTKYFCRVFRSMTHNSPMDYVNFYRIEQAAWLLGKSELSITEVASKCGFGDSSYFTKVFKKYKGDTPKEFRQRTETPRPHGTEEEVSKVHW